MKSFRLSGSDMAKLEMIRFIDEYAFLSNFAPTPFVLLGERYPTGEHGFQTFKGKDEKARDYIRAARTPREAKVRGRHTALRSDWEAIKFDVMRAVVAAKFSVDSILSEMLLKTGSSLLVEFNNWNDQIWGVDDSILRGDNWLGHLLMARRSELQAAPAQIVELDRWRMRKFRILVQGVDSVR